MSEQGSAVTSSQLATRNGSSSEITWSDDQKKLISKVIAPDCNSDELRLFAYHCQRTGLDPFSKQIYAIKRGGKLTIQVSIDGLRAIAERTGELSGSQKFWCGPDGEWKDVWLSDEPPAAAKAIVYRKNCSHPFVGIALFRDYNAGVNLWKKMPSVMLGKCAESQALRAGFPADLSGLYASEEMHQADSQVQEATVIEPVTLSQPDAEAHEAPTPSVPQQPSAPAVAEVVEESPAPAPEVSAPAPETPASLSEGERLVAAVQSLTATGKRALLKAYTTTQAAFADVKTIEEFMEIALQSPKTHLRGLTHGAIAALNEGRHPRTGEQLASKPGRRPAAPAAEADPENPFAEG